MPSQSDFDDDRSFRLAVEQTLADLLDALDGLDSDDFETRQTAGSLIATFEDDGSVFMLSQQTPTHELWLSANYTAWHFKHHGGSWVERDTAEPMSQVLSQLFSEKLDETIALAC